MTRQEESSPLSSQDKNKYCLLNVKYYTMSNILDQWFDEEASTCNISPINVINTLKKLGATKSRIKAVRSRSDTCNGVIFSVINKNGSMRAAKIVTVNPKSEVKFQKKLAKDGLAPKVFHSCKMSDNMWVIIMEKIDGSLGDLVGGHRSLSSKMLSRVYENVGYIVLPEGGVRLILIDFGWTGPYVPMFDAVSLSQALLFTRNKVNRDFLVGKMMKYIENRYDFKLPGSAIKVDTLIIPR